MKESENLKQKAIRLLNRQLEELQAIKSLNTGDNPKFTAWRNTTMDYLERFLGKQNRHTSEFSTTHFFSMPTAWSDPVFVARADLLEFQAGCGTADETLKAAIHTIEEFDVYEEQSKPTSNNKSRGGNSGGITQTFNAPVSIHNMAVAADNAIQKIEHMGDNTGASLKQIARLLQQSEELSPREVKEGLAHIEAVAVEVSRPEAKRNWKSIFERGNAILELTNKATDIAEKIAPYTPTMIGLMQWAKHFWIK